MSEEEKRNLDKFKLEIDYMSSFVEEYVQAHEKMMKEQKMPPNKFLMKRWHPVYEDPEEPKQEWYNKFIMNQ